MSDGNFDGVSAGDNDIVSDVSNNGSNGADNANPTWRFMHSLTWMGTIMATMMVTTSVAMMAQLIAKFFLRQMVTTRTTRDGKNDGVCVAETNGGAKGARDCQSDGRGGRRP